MGTRHSKRKSPQKKVEKAAAVTEVESTEPVVDNASPPATPAPVVAEEQEPEKKEKSVEKVTTAAAAVDDAVKQSIKEAVGTGVLTGDKVLELFTLARKHGFAIPAVNCTTTSTCNAVLEAARDLNSPIIIQCSQGGAAFFAGKGVPNDKQQGSIAGAVSMALHVRNMAPLYGVPVVVHSDHCAKKLLPWFDGMLEADESYFDTHNEPLFSSHMLDLSEETDEENISTCKRYFKRMNRMKLWLEMEIGITGGEEDGVDNSDVSQDKLYTQPSQIYAVYEALSAIGPYFSIAAAFGNVHGVYKPGNVKLNPSILGTHQEFIAAKLAEKPAKPATNRFSFKKTQEKAAPVEPKPCFFVFHGGSGSTPEDINIAVSNGVIKMNVDTDTQWAYWNGIRQHYQQFEGYLQGQIGNPEGDDKPNKKKYDPRVWLRAAEKTMSDRVSQACDNLGNVDTLALE